MRGRGKKGLGNNYTLTFVLEFDLHLPMVSGLRNTIMNTDTQVGIANTTCGQKLVLQHALMDSNTFSHSSLGPCEGIVISQTLLSLLRLPLMCFLRRNICTQLCFFNFLNLYMCYQELMSRPKGGRSVQLRGTAFESERSRHFIWTYSQVGRKCCFHSQSTTLGAPRSRCNARVRTAPATIVK